MKATKHSNAWALYCRRAFLVKIPVQGRGVTPASGNMDQWWGTVQAVALGSGGEDVEKV